MPESEAAAKGSYDFLAGGGDMGRIMRSHDWASTPLGLPDRWSQPLRTAIRLILNTGHPMYIWWGPELFCFYNDAYSRSIGSDRHPGSLGKPAQEVWAEIWEIIAPLVGHVMSGKGATWRENHLVPITRDGQRDDVYWTYSYSPLDDSAAPNGIGGVLVVCAETTQAVIARRDAEERSTRAQNRYRALFRAIDAGFCVIDLVFDDTLRPIDYRFVEVNPAFQAQTGLSNAEGRTVREVLPDIEQHWIDLYGEVALSGRPRRFEDGSEAMNRWFDVYAFRVDEDEPHRIAVLFNDISARRTTELALHRSEGDLRALNASLEERIDARTAELREAEEHLRQSQKMEALGQLTGGIAHDFNNLLTVIRGSAELLRRPDMTTAKRDRYIDAIASTAERASKLTSQLLAFARRQTLKPETFDAVESIKRVRDMIDTLTGSRVTVALELYHEPCFISADPSQFDTAIINIAVNARDAMDGAGTLTIKVDLASVIPEVRSHPAVEGSFVTITISDTGTGIAKDQIERIFEPFFTTKEVGKGTGLGLSQVFGFAKQSGGEIFARNNDSGGSAFMMFLPKVNAPDKRIDHISPSFGAAPSSDKCVLVVEDNPDVGAFATQALSELGYHTVLASDASAALAELESKNGKFDILFSDVVMPGMSGIELGQIVLERYPQLPVVLASGYSSAMAQNGTHGFPLLQKPYTIAALSQILQRATAHT
jgi:PAS domain S-box-containing protein